MSFWNHKWQFKIIKLINWYKFTLLWNRHVVGNYKCRKLVNKNASF